MVEVSKEFYCHLCEYETFTKKSLIFLQILLY